MAMILLRLITPQGKGNSSPEATTSLPLAAKVEKVAAISPSTIMEEPPPRPSSQPHEWKVLHHLPRSGRAEQSRSAIIRMFFNRPVEQGIVERAFSISPYVSGTFSWPKPDRLVFTPYDTLLPATRYTVSLRPISDSRAGHQYTLLEARWFFTTGEARTYRKDIKPVIAAYCLRCHGSNGSAAGIPLQTYSNISRYIIPGRSSESPFYTFIREQRHGINMAGPDHSTNDKLAIIKDWIDKDEATE